MSLKIDYLIIFLLSCFVLLIIVLFMIIYYILILLLKQSSSFIFFLIKMCGYALDISFYFIILKLGEQFYMGVQFPPTAFLYLLYLFIILVQW